MPSMRYYALACDYDGTLASGGRVSPETVAALERLRRSGRHIILVTGRELDDLMRVFPEASRCARIVAENGAVLHDPSTGSTRLLGTAPPPEFAERLRALGVEPLGVGHVIVSTWEPHSATVLQAIKESGLELMPVFNKGALMVLPAGINKGSGLAAALDELALSPHNVVGVGDAENENRPAFADGLLQPIGELRGRTGRPHWLVLDEAHHLLPQSWMRPGPSAAIEAGPVLSITVRPQALSPALLERVDWLLAVGESVDETIARFCQALGEAVPPPVAGPREDGDAVLWIRRPGHRPPFRFRPRAPRTQRLRHVRKYARGELGRDESFWFRGPDGRLNLRAPNLMVFLLMADGVDDATFDYHRRRGDYSRWFRETIKDEELASEVEQVENGSHLDPDRARVLLRESIEKRYTGAV